MHSRLTFFKKPSLDHFIHLLTGRSWNYHIKFIYRMTPDKANSGQATRSMTCSVIDRNSIASHRNLKKALASDMIRDLDPIYRTNGTLDVERLSFIGWYKRPTGPEVVRTNRHDPVKQMERRIARRRAKLANQEKEPVAE